MILTDQTADAARFLAHYAKRHSAGAFATPTAKELDPRNVIEWREGPHRTVAVEKCLTRLSRRADFTGREMVLSPGSWVLTHLAATPGAPVPNVDAWDYVFAYAEDRALSEGLEAQGRQRLGVRVTAASEVITCWGRTGERFRYPFHDEATMTQVMPALQPNWVASLVDEVLALDGWHDDFPYYSDGSWTALSLRGFRPDDPTVGVKPSEMPKTWKAEHPGSEAWTCEWTTLADHCPNLVEFAREVPWWGQVERVRLLRMAGVDTVEDRRVDGSVRRIVARPHRLGRHTDISDRAAGTRNGQIVRFHLPIVTHPDVTMTTWDIYGTERTEHLQAGRTYYLDARKPHAVTNPTPVDRVHLVVDVVSSPAVRARIADCEAQRQMEAA